MDLKIVEDDTLDSALDVLFTAAIYDFPRGMELTDKLEKAGYDFSKKFSTQIDRLYKILNRDEANFGDYGALPYTTDIDTQISSIFASVEKFESTIREILVNFHNDRADVLKSTLGLREDLVKKIADYATRRGLTQSPKDKPSRHGDLAITQKYLDDMKTCAPDSKPT